MKKIVVDSTVLFLLAKCGILESFCSRFKIIAPRFVINETASLDLAKKYTDASLIHDLVTRGLLNVEQPDTMKLKIPITLHPGERDALILALKSKNCLFATDDGKAIKAARFLKIPFIITPRIIVDMYILDEIDFNSARQAIEKLGCIGRYSPEIIAESILSLMEAKNGKTHNNKNT